MQGDPFCASFVGAKIDGWLKQRKVGSNSSDSWDESHTLSRTPLTFLRFLTSNTELRGAHTVSHTGELPVPHQVQKGINTVTFPKKLKGDVEVMATWSTRCRFRSAEGCCGHRMFFCMVCWFASFASRTCYPQGRSREKEVRWPALPKGL